MTYQEYRAALHERDRREEEAFQLYRANRREEERMSRGDGDQRCPECDRHTWREGALCRTCAEKEARR